MKTEILGYIKNGKLDLGSRKHEVQEFLDMHKEGKRVWLKMETYYPKRSLDQNKTIHWYFSLIADETGMSEKDVKDQMAKKFLTVNVVDKDGEVVVDRETGEVYTTVKETSKLSTVEMMEYMDKIRLWAIDFLNFDLPVPEKNPELRLK